MYGNYHVTMGDTEASKSFDRFRRRVRGSISSPSCSSAVTPRMGESPGSPKTTRASAANPRRVKNAAPAVTPGGALVRYDVYMASSYHDSYFTFVGSVTAGDPTPELALPGGAIAGSPEVVVEGPVARRYPRDAYFTVIGRDAWGRMALATGERVGKFTIDLPAAKVLLSLPLVTPSTSTLDVFAPIEGHWDQIRWFDASTNVWRSCFAPPRSCSGLPNVDRTMGLWLDLNQDAGGFVHTGLFPVVGKVPDFTAIPLYWYPNVQSWNLVGYPYLTVQYHSPFGPKTVAEALSGIPWVWVETYDPDDPPYYLERMAPDDLMLPGLGYWTCVSDAATWTLENAFPLESVI